MQDEVLAVIEASPLRRWAGVTMLSLVGIAMIGVASASPPAPGWQLFLIVVGALALLLAYRMYQATAHRIELTAEELRSSTGEVLARVTDIEAVERGVFAFKPSNGFLVVTSQPAPNAWRPGLWWRWGRRIGVGGVTAASQAKFMAEALLVRVHNIEA